MLKSTLCDYSDAYTLVKGTIIVVNEAVASAATNNINKRVIFRNCVPFTDCIREVNNAQVCNAENIDVVMPMHNLIEHSDNYSKTSLISCQYCRYELAVNAANGEIIDFNAASATTNSLKIKVKITGETDKDSTKSVVIMVPLKYPSSFWRTLEMPFNYLAEFNSYLE